MTISSDPINGNPLEKKIPKNIIVPLELLRNEILLPNLEDIINHYYTGKFLKSSVWDDLVAYGYAKIKFSWEEIKEILSKKKPQEITPQRDIPYFTCEWCHSSSYILHRQPYKKNEEMAFRCLCGSCSMEMHYLMDCYEFTNKFLKLFEVEGKNGK